MTTGEILQTAFGLLIGSGALFYSVKLYRLLGVIEGTLVSIDTRLKALEDWRWWMQTGGKKPPDGGA